MTVSTMLSQLGLRLEDSAKVKFPDAIKLDALENSQMELPLMLHKYYLTELEVLQESLTATSGAYALSSLTYPVLGGEQGILSVKIHSGLYCTKLDISDLKKTENTYYDGSAQNPLYYVFKDNIYVDNGTASPVIDVYYLKTPTVLTFPFVTTSASSTTSFAINASQEVSLVADYYNGTPIYNITRNTYHIITDYTVTTRIATISPATGTTWATGETFYFLADTFDQTNLSAVTCILNANLHNIVLDLAESGCWATDSETTEYDPKERSAKALEKAYIKITGLNKSAYEITGIGVMESRGL